MGIILFFLSMLLLSRSMDLWKISISFLCSIDKLSFPTILIFSFYLQLPISSSISQWIVYPCFIYFYLLLSNYKNGLDLSIHTIFYFFLYIEIDVILFTQATMGYFSNFCPDNLHLAIFCRSVKFVIRVYFMMESVNFGLILACLWL